MITKEEKIFIINAYLKELNCDKYVYNNKDISNLTQDEISKIEKMILFTEEKIQAIESEKIKIERGE